VLYRIGSSIPRKNRLSGDKRSSLFLFQNESEIKKFVALMTVVYFINLMDLINLINFMDL